MWKLFLTVFRTRLGTGRVSFGRKKKVSIAPWDFRSLVFSLEEDGTFTFSLPGT